MRLIMARQAMKAQISCAVHGNIYEMIELKADTLNISKSDVIRQALSDYLKPKKLVKRK